MNVRVEDFFTLGYSCGLEKGKIWGVFTFGVSLILIIVLILKIREDGRSNEEGE